MFTLATPFTANELKPIASICPVPHANALKSIPTICPIPTANWLKFIATICPIPTGLAHDSGSTSGSICGSTYATPTDWSPLLPYMPSLRDSHMIVILPMLHQRTKVHSYHICHPYGTLSPCTRTRGSTHIVTQCFSFGDTPHMSAAAAHLYQRTEVHGTICPIPTGLARVSIRRLSLPTD